MAEPEEEESPKLRRILDWTTVTAGIAVLGLLLFELGFPLTGIEQGRILFATKIGLWFALVAESLRIILHPERRRYVRRNPTECIMTALLLLLLAIAPVAVPQLLENWPQVDQTRMEVLYLGAIQFLVLGGMLHRLLRFNQVLAFARVSPRTILIGSYLGLIAIGTLLLKLPRATVDGINLSWIDAAFTSTSAVCVTGLIVVDTATIFTDFGQVIVLVLVQLGGLGLMTFTYFFVSLFGGGVTIRDRALLLDFLNEEHVGRITGSLMAIIGMTFAFEAMGTVLLYHATNLAAPGQANWFDSVFHSVAAFCNAGFSVYTDGLFDPRTRSNIPYQLVIVGLIVVGGLGFPVLKNMWDNALSRLRSPRSRPPRYTTHTKIVLVTTGALSLAGTIAVWGLEYGVADQPHYMSQIVTAFFTSVSSRTAGFNTVPVDGFMPATALVLILLMFIGGGPASTAGGIKTTTFAIALLNTIRILRNSTGDLVAFGRQIPARLANRAFAVALLAMAWVAGSTILLMMMMPDHDALDLMFEAVSAFGTAGLSRGATTALPPLGKALIIASMIVGRIGILYVALGVLGKEQRGKIVYPEANVIIS
jgi:trk system potassium uptake protein